MSGSKHFEKIAWAVTALMLVVTVLFMNGTAFGIEAMAHTMGYENRLFDNTRVHTLDIVMNNWDEFIKNATSEEYYTANLVIDGEAFRNVAIRGKGNTSLSSVFSLGSQRYSFKVEFDKYDSANTYYGLDKLSLNNLIQDSTMMKDYLTYTMMNEFGAYSPLCSFVYITVNGEDWGLYLAVEGIEDSFLERNFGSDYGELYKPDSMSFGGGRGNGKDFDMNSFSFSSSSSSSKSSKNSSFGGMGGFGMGSSDVKLSYIDDNLSSYSNIWNNAKTDVTTKDQERLINSLKQLTNNENIENVVNIEQVIRYFVVHNYVCNGDSYTGSMVHNYYLYEENGQLTMLPWDYNLAFGTFQGGNAQSTVNTPIDTPVSGGTGSDRPMWYWILSNPEYTELYHQYFTEFLSTVDIQSIIYNAYELIKPYVQKDPTAFYSYQEFERGVETMLDFCALRSESISLQLENDLTAKSVTFVDASDLTLSNMGSMGGMGGFGGTSKDRSGQSGNWATPSSYESEEQGLSLSSSVVLTAGATSTPNMPNMPEMPEGFDPSQMMQGGFSGEMPEGFDPSQMMQGGFDPSQMQGGNQQSQSGNSRPSSSGMQMPNQNFGFDMGSINLSSTNLSGWAWLAVSAIILAIGIAIAKAYKY